MSRVGDVFENPVAGERVVRVGTEESGDDLLVAGLYVRPGGAVAGEHVHVWGLVTERRFVLPSGFEVELGVAPPTWAATDPVDGGTRRAVADGMSIVYDPEGWLARLVHACGQGVRVSTGGLAAKGYSSSGNDRPYRVTQRMLAQQQVEASDEAREAYDEHPYAGNDVNAALGDGADAAALAPAAAQEGVEGEGERGDAYEDQEHPERGGRLHGTLARAFAPGVGHA